MSNPWPTKRKAIIEAKLNTILVAADSDTSDDDYSDSEHAGSTVGRISQSMQDGLTKIHGSITYWEVKEFMTILELAIWKLNLHCENDVKSRQQTRQHCGRDMQVIICGVLQFFDYDTNEAD